MTTRSQFADLPPKKRIDQRPGYAPATAVCVDLDNEAGVMLDYQSGYAQCMTDVVQHLSKMEEALKFTKTVLQQLPVKSKHEYNKGLECKLQPQPIVSNPVLTEEEQSQLYCNTTVLGHKNAVYTSTYDFEPLSPPNITNDFINRNSIRECVDELGSDDYVPENNPKNNYKDTLQEKQSDMEVSSVASNTPHRQRDGLNNPVNSIRTSKGILFPKNRKSLLMKNNADIEVAHKNNERRQYFMKVKQPHPTRNMCNVDSVMIQSNLPNKTSGQKPHLLSSNVASAENFANCSYSGNECRNYRGNVEAMLTHSITSDELDVTSVNGTSEERGSLSSNSANFSTNTSVEEQVSVADVVTPVINSNIDVQSGCPTLQLNSSAIPVEDVNTVIDHEAEQNAKLKNIYSNHSDRFSSKYLHIKPTVDVDYDSGNASNSEQTCGENGSDESEQSNSCSKVSNYKNFVETLQTTKKNRSITKEFKSPIAIASRDSNATKFTPENCLSKVVHISTPYPTDLKTTIKRKDKKKNIHYTPYPKKTVSAPYSCTS